MPSSSPRWNQDSRLLCSNICLYSFCCLWTGYSRGTGDYCCQNFGRPDVSITLQNLSFPSTVLPRAFRDRIVRLLTKKGAGDVWHEKKKTR
jgi:hypothetical protein